MSRAVKGQTPMAWLDPFESVKTLHMLKEEPTVWDSPVLLEVARRENLRMAENMVKVAARTMLKRKWERKDKREDYLLLPQAMDRVFSYYFMCQAERAEPEEWSDFMVLSECGGIWAAAGRSTVDMAWPVLAQTKQQLFNYFHTNLILPILTLRCSLLKTPKGDVRRLGKSRKEMLKEVLEVERAAKDKEDLEYVF